jgi:DNA repair protein RadC
MPSRRHSPALRIPLLAHGTLLRLLAFYLEVSISFELQTVSLLLTGYIFRAFASLSECDRERLYAVHMDGQNRVSGVELVSQGTLTSSLVTPREVYKSAILGNAAGLIAVHNHPSGNPAPSGDDRAITRQLVEAGRILDIPLYDHVIVGEHAYFSFAEAGLL